jgi:hypothetical protein
MVSSLKVVHDRPVYGQRFPGRDSRMNSGRAGVPLAAAILAAV